MGGAELELLKSCSGEPWPFIVLILLIVDKSLDNFLDQIDHVVHAEPRLFFMVVLAQRQELRAISLQQVNFVSQVCDRGPDQLDRFLVHASLPHFLLFFLLLLFFDFNTRLVLAVHVDVNEKLPSFLLLRQLDSIVECRPLLPTHFNSRIDIVWSLFWHGLAYNLLFFRFRKERLDLKELLALHVAVKKQLRVVFAVAYCVTGAI